MFFMFFPRFYPCMRTKNMMYNSGAYSIISIFYVWEKHTKWKGDKRKPTHTHYARMVILLTFDDYIECT